MKHFIPAILALFVFLATAQAGEESVATLIGNLAPTEVLRIIPNETPPNQRLDGLVFVAGYEAIGQPVALNAAQAARLSALVKDPKAFDTSEPEAKMRPGVAYRFGTGPDAVDLLICFSCDKAAVVPTSKGVITATGHITQPARDVLLGLAKELLPKDEAIQELPRIRSEHPIPPPPAPIPKDAPRPGQSE